MKFVPKRDLESPASFMPLWTESCESFWIELQLLGIV